MPLSGSVGSCSTGGSGSHILVRSPRKFTRCALNDTSLQMVKGGLRPGPSSGTFWDCNLPKTPCLFPQTKSTGNNGLSSHSALLPCGLHSTLPESILILSTETPRLPPTLPKSFPISNPLPAGLISSWRKPWSDTHMSLFSHSALANLRWNADGSPAVHMLFICRRELRGTMGLPFKGTGSRRASYQGEWSVWNHDSGETRRILSTVGHKLRKFTQPSSLQLWCSWTAQPSDPMDLLVL